ncbi:hypothetical protein ACFO6R_10920 [Eubacterium multiforme]|uniref:Membrane-associated HD superfamily phosphohydrolase n=1 Tax=Eubacterium multiforme TaxID=83339 RepID=A0ABT9UVF3_9FIRM|nr:hypothetical protein [Eubacterium multiforme]MDQ0150307.1 membrane-associated HD superfamily phosphohydrolase [Eubacterium multiforme]
MKKKIFIINIFLLVLWLICLKLIEHKIRLSNLILTNISINLMAGILTILLFSLLVQIIIYLYKFVHKRNKELYLKIIARLGIFLVVTSMLMYLMVGLILFSFERSDYIVEKNDKKMIACVSGFTEVIVEYYDYINIFVRRDKIRISEYYGEGGINPFSRDPKLEPKIIKYYDDNGNVIE